ncbi:hypothetical protein ABK040_014209 [Willaertia magna]
MFSPFGGARKPPAPKRKAMNETKRKLVYFITGCFVLSVAPYISEPIARLVSSYLGGEATTETIQHYDLDFL